MIVLLRGSTMIGVIVVTLAVGAGWGLAAGELMKEKKNA